MQSSEAAVPFALALKSAAGFSLATIVVVGLVSGAVWGGSIDDVVQYASGVVGAIAGFLIARASSRK
jgi:hypothetical protein